MDERASELWRHAPSLLATFQGIIGKPREEAKAALLEALGLSDPSSVIAADDSRATVEDYEFALQNAVLDRLEAEADQKVLEVADILDATASLVVELFERAAKPGVLAAETERCRAWWSLLLTVAEDASRLVPVRLLDRFVGDWESSLPRLRAAYLQLAGQRLQEFDAKQEAEQKAAEQKLAEETAEAGQADAKDSKQRQQQAQQQKEAKDRESKRIEERKKIIAQLGISPNGQLYLTLTSLLKQLSSRLCSSLHAPLRARIVLLLERLLAMDHKAIANNQKVRTQEYIQLEDLDKESEAVFGSGAAPVAAEGAEAPAAAAANAAATAGEAAPAGAGGDGAAAASTEASTAAGAAAPAATATSLGNDPQVDYELYQSFWGLQEALQYPERLFDKPDTWPAFHKALAKVLSLFLKYPTQDDAKQPWTPPEPIPLRHAPRARALSVQLDDPGFRQQFLTQVMIAFQALEQDGSSRRGDGGGLISRQADKPKAEFNGLKKLCEVALGQTRKDFPAMLKLVLEREAHWVSWKGYGCREFERESLEMLNGKIPPADTVKEVSGSSRPAKPQLATHVGSMLRALKDQQWKVPAATKNLPDEEAAKAMRLHSMRTMCDAYLERMLEEERPESGIEEEYKAKKNKVFMWQSRRLFCQQYLRVYAQRDVAMKTDFMDFVHAVKGQPLQPVAGNAEEAADDAMVPADGADPEDLPDAVVDAAADGAGEALGDTPGDAANDADAAAEPAADAVAPAVEEDATAPSEPPAVASSEASEPAAAEAAAEAAAAAPEPNPEPEHASPTAAPASKREASAEEPEQPAKKAKH